MSLATKLITSIVILLVAAVGTAGFYSYRSMLQLGREEAARRRDDGEKGIKARGDVLSRNLASSAASAINETNFTYLKELAKNAQESEQLLEWLVIIDGRTGKEMASAGRAPAAAAGATDAGTRVFESDVVDDQGVRQGLVRLGLSTRELEEELGRTIAASQQRARDSALKLAAVAVIVVLIGIALGMQQSLRITRPLGALTAQASRIAGGDFQQRVQTGSRDEIGQLASAFNSMAENLGGLLQQMAGKASMERELELARSVQELMSPPSALVEAGPFTLAGHCETATQCGGDWWTYKRLADGRLLVVVGDVTGHGMPAAMIAATARGAVEAVTMLPEKSLTPKLVLEAIDRAIRDVGSSRLLMTCFAMMLDGERGRLAFANAGHVFPYTVRSDGQGRLGELHALAVNGNPLGSPYPCVREAETTIRPGTAIIMSTDGLVDRVARGGERFGERRFRRLLLGGAPVAGVAELRDRVVGAVRDFGGGATADDDITLVVLAYGPLVHSGSGRGAGSAPRRGVA